jgi:hypothetical protein
MGPAWSWVAGPRGLFPTMRSSLPLKTWPSSRKGHSTCGARASISSARRMPLLLSYAHTILYAHLPKGHSNWRSRSSRAVVSPHGASSYWVAAKPMGLVLMQLLLGSLQEFVDPMREA